jgi:hypothetical protein
MVNDLQLKFHDEILFEETMDDNGRIYACVYVTKHRADVDTPLAQGIAPAPLVDTEGANTSAAHAAAVAAPAAPLSGTGRAATKRNFHRMEDSQGPQTDNRRTQRRQIETDAALVEDPLPSPSAATPVAAPTDPVPDAGASTQVPALFTLFLQMDEFLKRHGVPASVISDIKDIFFAFPEQSERVYNSIMEREGNPVEVRRRAEVWVKIFIQ